MSGLKLSIKNPMGSFKLKGPPGAVKDMASSMGDVMPKPVDLPDQGLPRALRTTREKVSLPYKFRYKGASER